MRSFLARGERRLRDGRAAGDDRRHERHPRHGHARLADRDAAREGRGARLPRPAVRAGHPALPAEVRRRLPGERRRARRAAVPQEEVHRPDDQERGVRDSLPGNARPAAGGVGGAAGEARPRPAGGRRPRREPGPARPRRRVRRSDRRRPARRAAWSASPARARRSRSGSSTAARVYNEWQFICDPAQATRTGPAGLGGDGAGAAASLERRSRGMQRGRGPGGPGSPFSRPPIR